MVFKRNVAFRAKGLYSFLNSKEKDPILQLQQVQNTGWIQNWANSPFIRHYLENPF